MLGAVVAMALVGLSLVAVRGFPAHIKAGVVTIDETFPPEVVRAVVWTDLASLLIFSTFVGAALYWRRRPDVHKRLMLLASMAILGPAVARIVSLLAAPQAAGGAIQILLLVGLPLTVLLHDLLAERRVHRTTIIGVVVSLVASIGAFAISSSSVGAALIAALEQLPG
jgi:hypothetical protein